MVPKRRGVGGIALHRDGGVVISGRNICHVKDGETRNVFAVDDGNDLDQVLAAFKAMEEWPADDRRPMVLVGKTTKGWWPAARDGKIDGRDQVISYPSHPYAFKMNSEYFVTLAESFARGHGDEPHTAGGRDSDAITGPISRR